MARSASKAVSLDRVLRSTITGMIEKNLVKFAGGKAPATEIRDLRRDLSRLERRVMALGERLTARALGKAGVRRGKPGRPPLHINCTQPDCNEPHYALGLCSKCYQRMRRGKLETPAAGAAKGKTKGRVRKTKGRAGKTGAKKKARRSARRKS